MLRPVLRGTDISAFAANPSRHLLFTHDGDGNALPALPTMTADYLASRREALHRRSDLRASMAPWSLFRVHRDVMGPKVVWRDLSQVPEACFIDGEQHAPLVLNTAYYARVSDRVEGLLLAAWLNSRAAAGLSRALAEHARGNYRRFFSSVIGLLPWPYEYANERDIDCILELSQALHSAEQQPELRDALLTELNLRMDHLLGVRSELFT